MSSPIESLSLQAELRGHNGWVTAMATHPSFPDTLLSASRDKTVIVWKLVLDQATNSAGVAERRLVGHNHFVSDIVLAAGGKHNTLYALTSSWDGSIRLWDVKKGTTKTRFVSHTKDVLSVAISQDNRQIASGSRDRTIRIWNILGKLKHTLGENAPNAAHTDWVSCVRFSPSLSTLVSVGWDRLVKVWDMSSMTLMSNLVGHKDYINTVVVSPDSTLCATAGRDASAILWDAKQGFQLYSLEAGDVVNALVFSPVRYWLAAATNTGVVIWDLKTKVCIDRIRFVDPEQAAKEKAATPLAAQSLAWSTNGSTLYVGYTDNVIRSYALVTEQQ